MEAGLKDRRIPVLDAPSAGQLQRLIESASIGIHFVAEDGTILWANQADHDLLGYTLAEYIGRNIADFHVDPQNVADILACLTGGQRIINRKATLRHKDGSLRHVLIDSSGHFEQGKFVHTQCFTRDVTALTEQTAIHEAITRAQSELGDGVVVCDDQRLYWANDAYAKLLGYTPEEVLRPDFPFRARLHASGLPAADERERERTTGASLEHRYDATLVRKDGSTVECEISVKTLHPGAHSRRICIVRDVTQQREALTRLQRDDAFLTRATMAIIEHGLDPNETMRIVARLAVERLADAANVDILEGADGLDRVVIAHRDPRKQPLVDELRARFKPHPDVRKGIERIPPGTAAIVNDIPLSRIEALVTHPDELRLALEVGYKHAILVPMTGRSGLIGSLTLTRGEGPGFTEQDAFIAKSLAARAAFAYENARLHATTRALENEWRTLSRHYQRILETAPAQVMTIDEEGHILQLNRSVRGASATSLLGVNVFDIVVEPQRERVKALLQEAIRTGKPTEYDAQAVLGPDNVRWFNVRVGPLELDGKRAAVLISTDIEDRRRADHEIASIRAQLVQGEKLSALGSLVSGVAHELRTPLTFLSNNAFLLKRRLDAATRRGAMSAEERQGVERYLAEITTGVDRINQLVEDLRRYTKARHDSRLVAAPLHEVVTDPIELFRATNRSSHRLESHLAPTAEVKLNVGSVHQIVLNLLQNAAEATPPGGALRVVTREDETGVVLEVQDEGTGIPREVQERMFEPLFTTKPEGTGLGLSIVRRIVEEHGARIECDSEPGRGTTFRVRFPRLG